MSFLLKDPEAVLDYMMDWGTEYLSAGDLLADSLWSVTPDEPGGLTVLGSGFDAASATVKAGGGVAGHLYRLANRITTAIGRVDERSIIVRVEDR